MFKTALAIHSLKPVAQIHGSTTCTVIFNRTIFGEGGGGGKFVT